MKSALAGLLIGQAAQAGEVAIGLGWDDMFDAGGSESVSVLFEYHSDPFYQDRVLNLSAMAVIQTDDIGDVFAGIGVYNRSDIGAAGRFFIEASLAIGHFDQGGHSAMRDNGTRLRSSLGGGIHLSDRARLSLSLDHILDMDFKNDHPGSETLHLRYTWGF